MLTMDGRISTFSFDTGNGSSEFMDNGSIEGLIESMTEFNTRDLRSLGELGVVSVLRFDQLEREDTANYTCTATNSLPQTITLTAQSPFIPLVVSGKRYITVGYCCSEVSIDLVSKLWVLHLGIAVMLM